MAGSSRPERRRRRRREPAAAAALLGRWRRGAGSGGAMESLARAWPEVVGAAAAERSLPIRRSRAGVVTVACSGAGWAQELAARSDVLVARLGALVPDAAPAALRFVVADHALPRLERLQRPSPARPGEAERRAARAAAETVADPALRGLLERAAASGLARARGQKSPAKRDVRGRG
jgi:hypothetical protein